MNKEKKLALKKRHDSMMDIRIRLAKGQPTTFSERNWLKIQEKEDEKKLKKS